MMPPDTGSIGLSFTPTAQNQAQQQAFGSSNPVQDAVKILSLKVPTVVGAQSLAPAGLLNAPGAGGLPGGLNLDDLLKKLFAAGGGPASLPPGFGGTPGITGAPSPPSLMPRITPGTPPPSGAPPSRLPGPGGTDIVTVPPGSPVVDRTTPPMGTPAGGTPPALGGPFVRYY